MERRTAHHPSIVSIVVFVTAAAAANQVFAQTCTVQSGVNAVSVLANPPGGAAFTATDFTAAAAGPAAPTVTANAGWTATLACDLGAAWISTNMNPAAGTSGLYSVAFPCVVPCFSFASLNVCFAVDNNLGNTFNQGVFLNGTPIPGTTCLSTGSACFAAQQQFLNLNVTGLVVPGVNTLQLFCNDFGTAAGIIFSATLSWVQVPCANDRCHAATPISSGLTTGDNVGATTIGSDAVGSCGLMGADVWYVYVPPASGTVTVDTCTNGSMDTVLAAWDGSCGCPGLVQLACNDDAGCGYLGTLGSSISFSVAANQVYYISVGGYTALQGSFTLNLSLAAAVPTNDDCANAIALPMTYKLVGTTFNATNAAAPTCNPTAPEVWYSFIALTTGSCTVSTCNAVTSYDTVLTVWGGLGCGGLVELACNDDACAIVPNASTVTFPALGSAQYWVSVSGFAGPNDAHALKISQDAHLDLKFFDEGPGSLGYRVADTGGFFYLFLTIVPGNYPNGWFGGIDISLADIVFQLSVPFLHGPMTRCGVVGPFFGLMSGLTIYAVALGVPTAGGAPTVFSAPTSFTIP